MMSSSSTMRLPNLAMSASSFMSPPPSLSPTSTLTEIDLPNFPPALNELFVEARIQLEEEQELDIKVPSRDATRFIEKLINDGEVRRQEMFQLNYENGTLTAWHPTPIQLSIKPALENMCEQMITKDFISKRQADYLIFSDRIAYTDCTNSSAGSIKAPDYALMGLTESGRVKRDPIWVCEAGWTGSPKSFDRDTRRWVRDTGNRVRLAISVLFIHRPCDNRVGAIMVFYARGGELVIGKELFPMVHWERDTVVLTRGDLFGSALRLEPGQTMQDEVQFDITAFREYAARAAHQMGLKPYERPGLPPPLYRY